MKFFHEGSSLKQEENEWQKLVLDKESEIMNVSYKFLTEGVIQCQIFFVYINLTDVCGSPCIKNTLIPLQLKGINVFLL